VTLLRRRKSEKEEERSGVRPRYDAWLRRAQRVTGIGIGIGIGVAIAIAIAIEDPRQIDPIPLRFLCPHDYPQPHTNTMDM
jgi:hypothetical protein